MKPKKTAHIKSSKSKTAKKARRVLQKKEAMKGTKKIDEKTDMEAVVLPFADDRRCMLLHGIRGRALYNTKGESHAKRRGICHDGNHPSASL